MMAPKTPKLILYLAATAVPIVLLFFVFSTYVYKLNTQLHEFDHKIDAVHAISILHEATNALQHIRGKSQSEAFQNEDTLHSEHRPLATFLHKTSVDALGAYASDRSVLNIRAQIRQLHKQRPAPDTAESVFKQYSAILREIHTYVQKVAITSGLVLETRHDIYSMVEMYARRLPELAETIARIRGTSARVMARGKWSAHEASLVKQHHSLLQHQHELVIDTANAIHSLNDVPETHLQETIDRIKTLLNDYITNTAVIFSAHPENIKPIELFDQGTVFIDSVNDLASIYASILQQALVSEQSDIRKTLISSIVAALLATILIAYFSLRFYRTNRDNLAELVRYKTTLDLTQDCIFMFEPDSLKFIYANQGACDQVGYSQKELLNMTPADITPEYDLTGVYKLVTPLMRDGGIGTRVETIHRHKNGTEIDVEISVQYLMPENELPRFVAIARDITERKQLEEILQSADAVLNNVVDGIITISDDGMVKTFNPAAVNIFGYSPDEVIGRNINMLMPSPYQEEHDSYLENYCTTGDAKVIGIGREVEGKRKDGSTFPMDLAVSEMWVGDERVFTGIVRDITERKNSENRILSIVNTVIDGIVTIDKEGTVHTFNPSAESIFGYTASEVIGNNVNMLMPSPYHEEHDGYLHNYINTGEERIIGIGREVEGKRKDGSTFPMDLAVSEMWIGDKRMFTGIVRDITERKKIERMKNEFISTVSHELRTPLTSIRGSIGLLLGGAVGNLSNEVTELLTIAGNNTERLLLLINDILDIQKMESGKMSFKFEYLDVMPFVKQAIIDVEAYAKQHNVTFRIASDIGEGKILADPDRLMQVMNNLLSNAAKFSPDNDTVDIAVSRHHDAIRISVTDYGPGIPENFQQKLFDKFTQSDSTDSRKRGGTGLGLNIAKTIIDKHGGRIGFVTQANIGTTMFIELPEMVGVQDKQLTDIELQPPVLQGGHQPCILIIEDDPDVAALLRRMLAEGGFNSDIAYNAAEAVQLLRQKSRQYQAITLDIVLPDKDGMTLLSELHDNTDIRDIPVVVVSIKADETRRDINGGAIGITDWLQKPIDEARLLEAVRNTTITGVTPRVLHVEDEADVHKVVSMMLKDKTDIVWSQTFAESCELLKAEHFDLVLLDIGLPDQSGLDLIPLIQQKEKPPRIIIFSAHDVPEDYLEQVHAVLTKSRTTNLNLVNTIKSLLPAGSF